MLLVVATWMHRLLAIQPQREEIQRLVCFNKNPLSRSILDLYFYLTFTTWISGGHRLVMKN